MPVNLLKDRIMFSQSSRRTTRTRPRLETLEDRTLLSTVTWINSAGGDWDTVTNWQDDLGNNRLPGPADDVIVPSGAFTVAHSSAVTDSVKSIANQAAIVLSGGTLDLSNTLTGNGLFTLSGGTLTNATVTVGTTITGTTSRGTLSRVTLNGALDLTGGAYGDLVYIADAFTLNGTVRLGNSTGSTSGILDFSNSLTVHGTGDILFGGFQNNFLGNSSGTAVILGPTLTVHGDHGRVVGFAGSPLINEGTIAVDVDYGRISISDLTNDNGTLSAGSATGATLDIVKITNTNSTLTLSGPGTILLTGTIEGGTVFGVNGGKLTASGTLPTLSGVTLAADLDTQTYYLQIANGMTVNQPVNVRAQFYIATSQTIGGHGSIVFQASGYTGFYLYNHGITLTLGPGLTVRGSYAGFTSRYSDASFLNQGTVGPDVDGFFEIKANFANSNGAFSAGSGARLFLYASSIIDNTNSTLTLSGAGNFYLWGGTIQGGTVVSVNGGRLTCTEHGGILSGLTLNADLDGSFYIGNPYVDVLNGLTFNGTASVGANFSAAIYFLGSQTAGGTGDILVRSHSAVGIDSFGGPVTFGPGLKVHGNGQIGGDGQLINQGTIAADVPGGTLTLGDAQFTWTNSGTLSATAGGTLFLAGTGIWLTPGQVTGDGGTVKFGAPIANANNTILLSGSSTFALTAATSYNGSINGGTIASANGGKLSAGGGTLSAVTLNADLDLATMGGYLSVANGLTINGTVFLGNAAGTTAGFVRFTNSETIGGTGTILFGGRQYGNSLLIYTSNIVVTIGPDLTIHGNHGAFGTINAIPGSFIIQGTIAADVPGGTISISSTNPTWTNNGTVEAQNGGILSCSNPTNFSAGTLTGGVWQAFDNSGLKVSFTSHLTTNAAAILLDGPNSHFYGQSFDDALANLAAVTASGAFTIQNGRTWTGAGDFANQGILTLGPGSKFAPTGAYLQNAGTTLLNGGTLAPAALVDLEGGILSGSGTISAAVQNNAEIDVGTLDSAGLLNITGNYTQTGTGVLNLKIGGYNPGVDFDQLTVAGAATLDGTLNITMFNDFVPNPDDAFQILTFASVTGDFAIYNGLDLGNGLTLSPIYDSTSLTLVAVSTSTPDQNSRQLTLLDTLFAAAGSMQRLSARCHAFADPLQEQQTWNDTAKACKLPLA
jgi:hypothetical protein